MQFKEKTLFLTKSIVIVWCSQSRNDVGEKKAVQTVTMVTLPQNEGCASSRPRTNLSLEGRHSGAHDLVDEEEIRGDDRARIEELHFDSIIIENSHVLRKEGFPGG